MTKRKLQDEYSNKKWSISIGWK